MADNTCMFGCFPEYEFKALLSLSGDRTQPDIQFSPQPHRFMSASLYMPPQFGSHTAHRRTDQLLSPGKGKTSLGVSALCAEAWRELGAILTTTGLKRIPKLGEEKNLPPPFKKVQYIESAGKTSDSSVKPSIH